MKEKTAALIRHLADKDIATYAASTTFFLFLSLFPLLILLSLLLPVTGLEAGTIIRSATYVTPDFIDDLVEQIIRETFDHAGSLVPISLLIALWSATRSMFALIRGIRLVYDAPVTGNYLRLNLASFVSTLALMLFLILSMLGLVFANALFHAVTADWIEIPVPAEFVLQFRYLIILCLMILFLTLLYTLISGTRQKFRKHLPGAVLASFLLAAFTALFSLYVSFNQNYSTIYGSFTTFVIMQLWAYVCIYIILLCGRINRLLR